MILGELLTSRASNVRSGRRVHLAPTVAPDEEQ